MSTPRASPGVEVHTPEMFPSECPPPNIFVDTPPSSPTENTTSSCDTARLVSDGHIPDTILSKAVVHPAHGMEPDDGSEDGEEDFARTFEETNGTTQGEHTPAKPSMEERTDDVTSSILRDRITAEGQVVVVDNDDKNATTPFSGDACADSRVKEGEVHEEETCKAKVEESVDVTDHAVTCTVEESDNMGRQHEDAKNVENCSTKAPVEVATNCISEEETTGDDTSTGSDTRTQNGLSVLDRSVPPHLRPSNNAPNVQPVGRQEDRVRCSDPFSEDDTDS